MKFQSTHTKQNLAGFVDVAWGAVFAWMVAFAIAGIAAGYFHWTGIFALVGIPILAFLSYIFEAFLFLGFHYFMSRRRAKRLKDSK
jgi:hypothetical protein